MTNIDLLSNKVNERTFIIGIILWGRIEKKMHSPRKKVKVKKKLRTTGGNRDDVTKQKSTLGQT